MLNRRLFLTATAATAATSMVPLWAQNASGLGTPTPPAPGFKRMALGDIEIIALNDGVARRPLGEEFVKNAPIAEVRAMLASQGLPTDHIDIPFTPFLVVAGGRKMLMDTGLGEFGGPTTGKLLDNLRAAGLQASDIDTVLISHFHGDHISGLRNKAGDLVFPNAKVMVPAPEYAFWMDDARMAAAPEGMKGAFMGVRRVFGAMPADKLVRFEPGGEVAPGVSTMAAYGHTPGHSLFQVSSGQRKFIYVADLTNVPALFASNPDWAVQFDMDAEAARVVRRKVFDMMANDKVIAGGFHFPFPAMGGIEKAGNGFAFKPV